MSFAPLFTPEMTITLWGPRSPDATLEARVGALHLRAALAGRRA
jgi:hypothetical protein